VKQSIDVTFELNGRSVTVTDVPPLQRLLDTLREELRVTGTKEGCGEGECGACTVLIDGLPVNSCLVPVVQLGGTRIVSVEGLGEGEQLSTLQRVFVEAGGAQCGICTPGILLAARALLDKEPEPSRDRIREAIAGNLCRCTGYQRIVEGIEQAAAEERAAKGA
jgi:aerobic carbon-monoxide dehydrogenase small subunit